MPCDYLFKIKFLKLRSFFKPNDIEITENKFLIAITENFLDFID